MHTFGGKSNNIMSQTFAVFEMLNVYQKYLICNVKFKTKDIRNMGFMTLLILA